MLQSEIHFWLSAAAGRSEQKGSVEGQWIDSLPIGTAVFISPRALQPADCVGTLEAGSEMANGEGERTEPGWRGLAAGRGRFGPSEGLVHCLCTARVPGMSPSGMLGWGAGTCLMLTTDQKEKSWGGKGEWRLMLSRAALRVCAPKLRLRAPPRAVVETRC